jgi:hypothetical protein
MFFRHERPKTPTFSERLENVRRAGFTVTPLNGDVVRVARGNIAADLAEDEAGGVRVVAHAGVEMNGEIGALIDSGYQKLFRTPTGKQRPALAHDLKDIHDFEEDLKESLGEQSYYNESLGTVSTYYIYDRVENRDRGVPKRVWES